MITGEMKNRVDSIWDTIWTGGITSPITVLEQITYLMFMKLLDDNQLKGCLAGINTALDYYVKYRKELPKDKGAETFLKLRDKGKLKAYLVKSMPE